MNIVIDTREKNPWTFEQANASTTFRKLDTGDYALDGLEHLLCIERKRSVAELANNLTDSRFKRELERMAEFPNSFLILEFDYRHIDTFPEGSEIPKNRQKQVKVRGPFIIKCLSDIMLKYNIQVLPCSHVMYAESVAYSLMKNIYKGHTIDG